MSTATEHTHLPADGWGDARAAAAYLRCSTRHLMRLVRRGKVRAIKLGIGRGWRFSRTWLDEDIAGLAVEPRRRSGRR